MTRTTISQNQAPGTPSNELFNALPNALPSRDAIHALNRRDAIALALRLRRTVTEQEETIAELRARLAANSANSSAPPSSDGYEKPSPKSRRKPTGRKPGGQPGAAGHHLAQRAVPDKVVPLIPEACESCGSDLSGCEVTGVVKRQVFDLPEPQPLNCTQYDSERRLCPCGHETTAAFPVAATAFAVYGPRIRARVAYLSAYQHIPVDRIAQMLFDEYDVTVSTGAIVAMIAEGAELLKPFTAEVKRQLATAPLACADETGLNAKGLKWVHTLSTDKLTLYHLDEKRGYAAMLAAGVLSSFKGVLVHDGWGAYRKLVNVIHALCNAHHIRELVGVEENTTQAWPAAMRKLLSDAYVAVCEAKQKGDAQLTDEQLARVTLRYRLIVMLGHLENPEPTRVAGRHGRVKRTKAANLLRRLGVYEADVLRFAHDFAVPFDNNLAERDIRMVKVHQKISGCFRSTGGAENFLALRSYLSTARKNDVGLLGSLQLLFEGQPWLPLG